MFTYVVRGWYLELTATGFVSADEAAVTFRAMRADPAVPDGLPYLMDLRQYDQSSIPAEELEPRVRRMLDMLGPRIGAFWAVVIGAPVEHFVKGRLLQSAVPGDDATVMLFREMDEAKEWLQAMTERRARNQGRAT